MENNDMESPFESMSSNLLQTNTHKREAKTESPLLKALSTDNITIEVRKDGYVNASKLCRVAGKEWSSYFRTAKTKAFLEVLARSLQIPKDLLISTTGVGPNALR